MSKPPGPSLSAGLRDGATTGIDDDAPKRERLEMPNGLAFVAPSLSGSRVRIQKSMFGMRIACLYEA